MTTARAEAQIKRFLCVFPFPITSPHSLSLSLSLALVSCSFLLLSFSCPRSRAINHKLSLLSEMTLSFFVFNLALAASVRAHTGFWAPGMYCKGVCLSFFPISCSFVTGLCRVATQLCSCSMFVKQGTTGKDDQNSNAIVQPLYQLPFNQWWCKFLSRCHLLSSVADVVYQLVQSTMLTMCVATRSPPRPRQT